MSGRPHRAFSIRLDMRSRVLSNESQVTNSSSILALLHGLSLVLLPGFVMIRFAWFLKSPRLFSREDSNSWLGSCISTAVQSGPMLPIFEGIKSPQARARWALVRSFGCPRVPKITEPLSQLFPADFESWVSRQVGKEK